jgi:peptidoglycan/LPS O-acetylase OafA/YrhL
MSEPQTSSTRARALNLPLPSWRMFLRRDANPASDNPDAKKRPADTQEGSFLARRGRSGPATSTYRSDIDGLRAIAVLGVIFMHASFGALTGGFLGVDVFFVISGYLVHQQIASRLRTQSFSLFDFYGRRIRRTFPALYLIAAFSLAAGMLILMPGDLMALGQTVIAAALGTSNILFAVQTGYFDHSSYTKPLLHSWSLGVEEQYYLVAPLIPFALRNFSAPIRRTILLGLFSLALGFCVIVQSLIPTITFFMMPPRLWEFLLGSLIAEGFVPTIKRQAIAELASCIALAALLASMLVIRYTAVHPGLVTLIPCLATALLIHLGATTPTVISRLLGAAPLAFCGLISYSLYLWHWPLIVFAHYVDLPWTPTVLVIGVGLLFALSFLSWKYVETPFRDPASWFKRHAVPILLTGLGILVAASSAVIGSRGLPERFPAEVVAVTSYSDYADRRDFREGKCFITSKYGDEHYFDRKDCLQISASAPNYLLIGDSQAAHLWAGFSRVFSNVHILQATASGCKPLLVAHGLRYCVDLMHEMLINFLPTAKLDGVIISAAWDNNDPALLKATLDYVKRFVPEVIVLGNMPSHEISLPNLLGRSLIEHRPELVIEQQSPYSGWFDASLKAAIDPKNYVSLVDLLCPEGRCIVYAAEHVPLQFDTSHLTTEGSILVAQRLAALPLFAPLVEGRNKDIHK